MWCGVRLPLRRTSPRGQWDADTVFVTRRPCRHTRGGIAGKTAGRHRSKQGMTIQPSRAGSPTLRNEGGGPAVDVVAWRAGRLRDAGFPAAVADTLARQRVDLHSLLQLVDRGCPPELAARILAPTDATGSP